MIIALLIFILAVATALLFAGHFRRKYQKTVQAYLQKAAFIEAEPITTGSRLKKLPLQVQRYLEYTGTLKGPRIRNFCACYNGQIRKDENSAWMPFSSQQYNFIDNPGRFFFMRARMKGLPVSGLHCYEKGKAFMDIRLLSLLQVEYQEGKEMNIAETVTYFNDLCLMAPTALVDDNIHWEDIDDRTVRASFTVNSITIRSLLYFEDNGQLVNFMSDDRYYTTKDHRLQRMRWSTPVTSYKNSSGYLLPASADLVWHFPQGDFCYGRFYLQGIEYNRKTFK